MHVQFGKPPGVCASTPPNYFSGSTYLHWDLLRLTVSNTTPFTPVRDAAVLSDRPHGLPSRSYNKAPYCCVTVFPPSGVMLCSLPHGLQTHPLHGHQSPLHPVRGHHFLPHYSPAAAICSKYSNTRPKVQFHCLNNLLLSEKGHHHAPHYSPASEIVMSKQLRLKVQFHSLI